MGNPTTARGGRGISFGKKKKLEKLERDYLLRLEKSILLAPFSS